MNYAAYVQAFWNRVDKVGAPDTGCWLWTGRLNEFGYGMTVNEMADPTTNQSTRTVLAHRMSWNLAHPDKPCVGYVVMHMCDIPRCVNPDHLKLGTQLENNRDATRKGRAGVATPEIPSAFSSGSMIVDETVAEPGDDIQRLLTEAVPALDIPQRRAATARAFRERDALVCVLSKLWQGHLMRSPDRDPSYGSEWQWSVCLHGPKEVGQVTWRIHDSDLVHYEHLTRTLDNHWDGHNTKMKYERLAALKPKKRGHR